MKETIPGLFVLLIGCCIIASCGKPCVCNNSDGLRLLLIGFTNEESDTIIVRKFKKTGNFSEKIDSTLLDSKLISFQRSNDTLSIASQTGNNNLLSSYDYEVVLPAATKTFRIGNINEESIKTTCGGIFSMDRRLCINPIKSYKINDLIVSGSYNYTSIVLKK
jgi:hypothetical protein